VQVRTVLYCLVYLASERCTLMNEIFVMANILGECRVQKLWLLSVTYDHAFGIAHIEALLSLSSKESLSESDWNTIEVLFHDLFMD